MVTALLVIYLTRTAKATNNLVVKADAMHYKTDLYANLGVLVSLALVKMTGNHLIDAFVGAVIAIYIIYSAYEILREGVLNLLDVALAEEMVEQIKSIINKGNQTSAAIISCAPARLAAIILWKPIWSFSEVYCWISLMMLPIISRAKSWPWMARPTGFSICIWIRLMIQATVINTNMKTKIIDHCSIEFGWSIALASVNILNMFLSSLRHTFS